MVYSVSSENEIYESGCNLLLLLLLLLFSNIILQSASRRIIMFPSMTLIGCLDSGTINKQILPFNVENPILKAIFSVICFDKNFSFNAVIVKSPFLKLAQYIYKHHF